MAGRWACLSEQNFWPISAVLKKRLSPIGYSLPSALKVNCAATIDRSGWEFNVFKLIFDYLDPLAKLLCLDFLQLA